jgi:hypothetical protein
MMMATSKQDDVVQSTQDYYTNTTQYNQLCYMVRQIIMEMLNTSAIVSVNSADAPGHGGAAGNVVATPLVAQTDAKGNALPMAKIPQLRFFRYQAGKAAIVLDPVAGDQGVAVFFKQDHSGVKGGATEAVVPGSFRNFDQSDGVVFPSVQGAAPTVWIELKQDETITIHAPEGVKIESTKEITLTAPKIELNGAVTSNDVDGGGSGTMKLNGTMTVTQDVKASNISLNSHTHTCPDGETSGPH